MMTPRLHHALPFVGILLALAIAGCPETPTAPPCPTCAPTCAPTATATVAPPTPTPVPITWDSRLSDLGVTIEFTGGAWDLEAAWITINGNWDTAPQWAKERYPWTNLGGDHHAYGMAIDGNGVIRSDAGFILQWPDGADQRTPDQCSHPQWANIPLYAGYDWSASTGPYSWGKFGGDELHGLGLPYPPLPWDAEATALGGMHVSFFGVWREHS